MFSLYALVMVLAASGELLSQCAHQVEVRSSGEAALLQMGSSVRPKATFSSAESLNASEGPQHLMQSQPNEQRGAASNARVWEKLKSVILEDLKNTTFVPPTDSKILLPQRTATGCGVLWYYHIGKCAGSSILQWLLDLKARGGAQEVFDLSGEKVNFTEFRDQQLQPWVSNMKNKLVAVHHHHNGPGLYGMDSYFSDLEKKLNAQGCSLIRFTVLRQPAERLISHVNYDMQILNGDRPAVDKATHDNFLRAALSQSGATDFENRYDNHEVRYTLNNWGLMPFAAASELYPMPFGDPNTDALAAVTRILDGFNVVGIVEEVDVSIKRVTELLGLPPVPVPQSNVRRKGFQQHDKLPLPDDVRALIEQRTRLDLKLYQHYASKSSM